MLDRLMNLLRRPVYHEVPDPQVSSREEKNRVLAQLDAIERRLFGEVLPDQTIDRYRAEGRVLADAAAREARRAISHPQ